MRELNPRWFFMPDTISNRARRTDIRLSIKLAAHVRIQRTLVFSQTCFRDKRDKATFAYEPKLAVAARFERTGVLDPSCFQDRCDKPSLPRYQNCYMFFKEIGAYDQD